MKLAWLILVFPLFAHAEIKDESFRSATEMFAAYETFGNYLDSVQAWHLASPTEVKAVESFLKTKGITRDTHLTPEVLKDNRLRFGTKEVVLNTDGSLKTGEGRLLKYTKGESFDQFFIESMTAFEQKTARNGFIPEANAGEPPKDSASAAGYGTLETAFHYLTIGVGKGADLIHSARVSLEWYMHAGHVHCGKDGSFHWYNGYKYFDYRAAYRQARLEASALAADGHNPELQSEKGKELYAKQAVAFARIDQTMQALPDTPIPQATINEIWKPAKAPKCDDEYNAKDVEALLKESGRTIREKLANYSLHDGGAPAFNRDYGVQDDSESAALPRVKSTGGTH